jgi:hypothetical protein
MVRRNLSRFHGKMDTASISIDWAVTLASTIHAQRSQDHVIGMMNTVSVTLEMVIISVLKPPQTMTDKYIFVHLHMDTVDIEHNNQI